MSVTVTGIDSTIQALYAKTNTLSNSVDEAVRRGAVMIMNDSTRSIAQGVHTGKTYKRGNKTHKASAPGEAPATDTGTLVKSIQSLKSIYGDGWLVGSNLDYARFLEFGTKNMGARPWLIPALEKNRSTIYKSIQTAMKAAL